MLDVNFWQNRYETQNTGWDLAGASPHFIQLLKEKPAFLKPGKMAVLGSGRGHDAACFAQAGFEVTGFDYAPGAVQEAQTLYAQWANFESVDIFTLANTSGPYAQSFDYVLEHTCFCAISPERRADYLKTVQSLLKPGGYLIGIFWEHGDPDGPPFSSTLTELETLFSTYFQFVSLTEKTPAANRSGVERLILLRRKTEI